MTQSRPVLTSKITPPFLRADLLARERLFARLDSAFQARFTLVAAPAGSGKTSLAAAWASAQAQAGRARVAWVSLEDSENDPVRFWSYTLAACESAAPGLGADLWAQLAEPQWIDWPAWHAALLNRLAALPGAGLLLLDDYHLIRTERIHQDLAFWVEHLPRNLSLILLTRADPPLPLARWRARGELAEIRAQDLAFTPPETTALFGLWLPGEVPAGGAERLCRRTEGWAAGLRLAALALRGAPNPQAFIQSFAGAERHVLDYLMEEVFHELTPEQREFLLETSFLERLSGPLCDAVTGRAGSQALLEALERSNGFITPLDAHREWFRCHALFRDALRKQWLQGTSAARQPQLEERAAVWFAAAARAAAPGPPQAEALGAAIQHILAAGRPETAAALIAEFLESLHRWGEFQTLARWWGALPESAAQTQPLAWVSAIFAAYIADEQPQPALRQLERLAALCPPGAWNGPAHTLRALIAFRQQEFLPALELAQTGLDEIPENLPFWRALGAFILANVRHGLGRAEPAAEAWQTAIAASRASGNPVLEISAVTRLALAYFERGELRRARLACEAYFASEAERGLPALPARAQLAALRAQILCEQGEQAEALVAANAAASASQGAPLAALSWVYLCLLRVQAAEPDHAAAWQTLETVDQWTAGLRDAFWLKSPFDGWRAALWLAEGRLELARAFFAQNPLPFTEPLAPRREHEYLAYARLLALDGQTEAALALFAALRRQAHSRGAAAWEVAAGLREALALHAAGQTTAALAALAPVLDFVEREGAARSLYDAGEPAARLLRAARQHGLRPQLIDALLNQTPQPPAPSPLVEPLSQRESEVLQLIHAGLSNAQIAERLVVSLTTIKWHTAHIYAKLGVNRRTEALARARELGLLA